jgi:hypothetical protein
MKNATLLKNSTQGTSFEQGPIEAAQRKRQSAHPGDPELPLEPLHLLRLV